MPEEIGSAIPGGVIAYISSGSASSPESCMSGSSNGGYLSSSPPRHSLPSRAVGMVVDIAPPAKHQRGHGTEKAGRSPSSAKSNLTKINGMVLLCKVCGDVASGFHYGVHACEGCKGFFRRSIQQNIQYKKCLKMDSCTIMRINRNRCQQCRFKKCLAVGMSRDAVRFGRIPKREKQRMLLEMQNAMNNMMSNNSQLHSMLQGSQSPPLTNGVCPSSSSSTSSSSSCSNPASPQDSESVVSMDTNSSSASSCSSDSGEDEASSRQDPMAFEQQPRSTKQPAGTPLPVGREPGNDSHVEEERRQSWNRWNDSVAIGSHQHAHYHSHQATANDAYRAGNIIYQQAPQQAHGSGSAIPEHSQSHQQQREQQRSMQAFSNHYSGPAYNNFPVRTNAPTYMGAQKANQEIWEEFSMSFAPAVREVVEFAKRIPGFRDLSEHDQVSLLKAGTFEVLMVRFASLFDKAEQTVTFLSGKRYSLEALRSCGAGDLLTAMCEFSEKLSMLQLDQDEMSLFTAVVLVSADRTSIHNLSSVETLQDELIQALRNLINKNHAGEAATFTKLLLKLPELRSLNNIHSEELLAFTVHP